MQVPDACLPITARPLATGCTQAEMVAGVLHWVHSQLTAAAATPVAPEPRSGKGLPPVAPRLLAADVGVETVAPAREVTPASPLSTGLMGGRVTRTEIATG